MAQEPDCCAPSSLAQQRGEPDRQMTNIAQILVCPVSTQHHFQARLVRAARKRLCSRTVTPIRPGDISTHMYKAAIPMLDERGVLPYLFEARKRGVLFDVGHGSGSFTWRVARAALAQGFPPDTISSDIHTYNHAGPVHDLPRTLSKLLHLGMPLHDVIATAFANAPYPVAVGLPSGHGRGTVTIPFGIRARLAGERLTLLESPFAE